MSRFLLLLTLALSSSGCFTTRYLVQAAAGQYELLHVARPIPKVLADSRVPPRTRHLLSQVEAIKSWGQTRGLKPTNNYGRYADLHRPAAVWVVQACAPLKFDVRRWQFPIVGTVPYLGFFSERPARAYADQLANDEALDVSVRTASAYSTLGWFRDPVLSTMISDGDEALGDLVNVILHESVHATFYLANQTSFNESAASFVADGLTVELLEESFGKGNWLMKVWLEDQRRGEAWAKRLHEVWEELDGLYSSDLPDAQKLEEKARILTAVQKELGLRRPLNNASIAGSRTYESSPEGFSRLRKACDSWPRTLAALTSLEQKDFEQPQQEKFDRVLDGLAQRACSGAPAQVPAR
jgi:predicted aminopeptidase